ncbi:ATP synthase subunit I [Terriglobus albidus]|uniref:ATP synthase subunit I n=1 Tax=Terriglobus albidus TaxID=1592106 RepID=UPI0021DF645D|nr:ATP synthase subunit I [Terriglobus albidus]
MNLPDSASYTDDDFRRLILRAMKLATILALVGAAGVWLKWGWRSAVLLLVGALISTSGLWEWLRLMTAIMVRMDANADATVKKGRSLGLVLAGFFLRLGLTLVALYVSLKFLDGSVYALAAGLGLGVFALAFEGAKLARVWTV